MKNPLLSKLLPHLIAVVIFLVVALLFCKPVLEGNVLNQDDITKWKGIAENSFKYKEANGHYPLWNPNLFSGMPNYQIAMEGKSVMPPFVEIFALGMPKPVNFFFLACICFYILCLALRIKPVIAILGGLAYAFSTYNAVVINAGHDTQMLATAFMPLLFAGLIFTFEKKYWLGLSLTTYATYQQVGVNHLQITYYTFLIAVAITIAYLIIWIKKREWKHIAIAAAITLFAAIVGLAGNALILKTTSEYAKYTMRGGKDINIEGDKVEAAKTSGLDTAYAFEYSLGKAESFTLLMPNAFGGGSGKNLAEDSKVVDKLTSKGVDQGTAMQLAQSLPKYWGSLPFTSGPAYLGIFICILGLIGFVVIKKPLRWGLLAATVLGIVISWGKNLPGFNTFLFETLPFYNKFRAPSMAQVIPQFTIGVVAVLALQQMLYQQNKEQLKADFKRILFTVGGLFALLALMYLMMDYSAPYDNMIRQDIAQQAKNDEVGRAVIDGMRADRKAMFGGQLLRAAGFTILLLGTLYLYLKNTIKAIAAAIVLIVISTLELAVVSHEYLGGGDDDYVPADELVSTHFTPSAFEQEILQDKDSSFRVFNTMVNPLFDARTSYFFKSITGYHPARLRIYQDVLDRYISGRPNPNVLNMLNAKYVVVQDPQSGQAGVIRNSDANGPCWLAKHVKLVDDRVQAFLALDSTNLKDTAIVEKAFAKNITQPQWDSASSIRLVKFDNDAMEYEANCNGPQFAVFSEIFYPKGWNAYLDGKKVEYVNANYILRGLSLPAGKHSVKFVFEPESFKSGVTIMYISSFIILIVFVGGLFMAWRERRKTT